MSSHSPASRLQRAARGPAVLVALLVLGPLAGTAAAHATLVSSSPARDQVVAEGPAEVRLTFDEPVGTAGGEVVVLDPTGTEVQRGRPEEDDGGRVVLQAVGGSGRDGTHTVSYRVLSRDGHVVAGSYVFHVGEPSGTAASIEEPVLARAVGVVGRWIAFGGAVLAGGVLAMALLVDRGPGRAWTGGLRAGRRLLRPAAAAVLVGSTVALLASAADLAGGSVTGGLAGLDDVLGSGRAGAVAGVRVLVALVLVVAVAGEPLLRRVPGLAAVAIGATLVLPSLGGHAATTSPAAVAVGVDAVHVVAVAAWVGGLAVLALTWSADRDRLERFSSAALVAAPVVVLTGVGAAWLQLRNAGSPVGSDHGRLVLAKVVGATAMLLIGALHRRALGRGAGTAGMRPTVTAQVLIGAGVLAVTAVLVATPPPGAAARGPTPAPLEAVAGDVTVRMEVDPGRAGPNDVHLHYSTGEGSPVSVDAAELTVSTVGVEPRRVPLTPITPSHATVPGVQLTPGTWRFELTLVAAGTPATTSFEVPIR